MKLKPLVISFLFGLFLFIFGYQASYASDTLSTPSVVADQVEDPIVNSKRVKTGQFENGLRYVIQKKSKPKNQAKLWLLVKAGSLQEDEQQRGLAHFVEHMAFNGTQDFPKKELVNYIESVGMKFGKGINATTSFDKTIYKLDIPTDKPELFENSFKILENWAHKISFDPNEIEDERGVILEEWRCRDSANYRLSVKHKLAEYKGTDYAEHFPVIGTPEAILHGKAEDMIRFYKQWYQPQNMTVLAVGDFQPAQVRRLIEKYMGSISGAEQGLPVKKYSLPDHIIPLVNIATDPQATTTQIVLTIDENYTPVNTYNKLREKIKRTLFAEMLKQRLFKAIRENRSPAVKAHVGFYSTAWAREALRLEVISKPGEAKLATEFLLSEAYRVVQLGFSEQELQRIKSTWRDIALHWKVRSNGTKRLNNYINQLMHNEPLNDYHSLADFWVDKIDELSLAEINAEASNWLMRTDNRSVFISAPDSELASLPMEKEIIDLWDKASTQGYQSYQEETVPKQLMAEAPLKGDIVKRSYDKRYDSHIWTLSNDAKVVLKKTDFRSGEIQFKAIRNGGLSLLDDETYRKVFQSAGFLDYMGISDFSINALKMFLLDKKIKLATKFTDRQESLEGSTAIKDLDTFMQLVHLKFTKPRTDEKDFNHYIASKHVQMEKNGNVPWVQFAMAIAQAKNSNNPRYIENYDTKTLEVMDLDASYQNYLQRFTNAGDFTFVFVGDFKIAKMEELVNTYIASLPGNSSEHEVWQLHPDKRTKGHLEVHLKEGMNQKAKVWLEMNGYQTWSNQSDLVFKAVKNVLNVMLRERIREELGGTYVVSIKGKFIHQEYSLGIQFDCEPERVDELVNAVRGELDSIKQKGVSPNLLENFKKQYANEMKILIRRNSYWRNNLDKLGDEPLFALDPELYTKALADMTVEQVNQAMKEYLNASNSVYATLLPKNSKVELTTASKETALAVR
jgi:zinc protease